MYQVGPCTSRGKPVGLISGSFFFHALRIQKLFAYANRGAVLGDCLHDLLVLLGGDFDFDGCDSWRAGDDFVMNVICVVT